MPECVAVVVDLPPSWECWDFEGYWNTTFVRNCLIFLYNFGLLDWAPHRVDKTTLRYFGFVAQVYT